MNSSKPFARCSLVITLCATLLFWLLLIAGCAQLTIPSTSTPTAVADLSALPPDGLPWGVAAGDVDQTSVVLWTRSALSGVVTITHSVDADSIDTGASSSAITRTIVDPALPLTVTLTDLAPDSVYTYQVTAPNGDRMEGRFKTAVSESRHTGLRFGISGDWHSELRPYLSIANAPERALDFFVALGDTVYADFSSTAVPKQAQNLDEFRTKHAEVYATRYDLNPMAALRASTAWFATIDDHEVLNNFAGGAPAASSPYFGEQTGLINQARLYRVGLQTFLEYHPLHADPYPVEFADARMAGRPNLYRYRTFGADAALFLLDMRSFRDAPLDRPDPDDPESVADFVQASFAPGRTVLGQGQLAQLQADLLAAHEMGVVWKFVAVPDPIQHLDMIAPQDRFQGYAAERAQLLGFIQDEGIENVVFVAADIHGTLVNEVYQQTAADAPLTPTGMWEITVGPVALYAPYGLTKILTYQEDGLLTEDEYDTYLSLPAWYDEPNNRDSFVEQLLNREIVRWGYDPIGLDPALVDAELRVGDYSTLHSFGWTEFEIDGNDQTLTVTTYGIRPYATSTMAEEPASILDRRPQVVSQFVVQPR